MKKKSTIKRKAATRKSTAPKKSAKNEGDIISIILEDHKPLKKFLTIMKGKATLAQKQKAYSQFAPLLTAHAKPEEKTLYISMKNSDGLKSEAFEAEAEHFILDQLIEEIKGIENEDVWFAKVKVLAEIFEKHIEEEEKVMFAAVKKQINIQERLELGLHYLTLKKQYEAHPSKKQASKLAENAFSDDEESVMLDADEEEIEAEKYPNHFS
jgi:hemerythrin superfamily protein